MTLTVITRGVIVTMMNPATRTATKTILVIEDDRYTNQLICDNLQMEGYHVITTQSGENGLKLASEHHPDIILLDLLLPGIDGWEVIDRLHCNDATKNIPIVVVSILSKEEIGDPESYGIIGYLNKPFDANVLASEIKRLLDRQ